ncbi:hypothetical protein HQN89_33475 [Paenibacillus frigoriresistens]|uniref:Ger(x)C family spore germination C-terminal domain-containing protein n=1 Tax=Paenibacillus alginolyticus TaxID=59839 RepID=UPI0015643539|nr:Ger(x)C family spore germination C-terminal domain-containing protein [Paenibacillus frigoriresistens]NRF95739.1 hypothetical protein [Paenibacillus frigoriresistens]
MTTTVKDTLMSIYNGGDMLLPMLVFGKKGAEREENGKNWVGVNKAAILRQGKMVSVLNMKEMRSALLILGGVREAAFDVTSPSDSKEVSVIVRDIKTKVKPRINGDHVSLLIDCKAKALVLSTTSNMDVTDSKQLSKLEDSLDKELQNNIAQLISKSKSVQADAFQFSNYLKWRYPQKWQSIKADWRERYATSVEVDPLVHITIKWFGAVKRPEWNQILK